MIWQSLAVLALSTSAVKASPFAQPADGNPSVTTRQAASGALLPGLVTTPSPAAFNGNAFKWYYNYAGSCSAGLSGADYVPMFHDATNMQNFRDAKPSGQFMLSMNEPDVASGAGGAQSDAGKAVDDHISVFGTNSKPIYSASVGSIATCSQENKANVGLEYMVDWLNKCKAKDCKVDFMAVHWYSEQLGGDDQTIENAVDALTKYIQHASDAWNTVYSKRPSIWLTEYGHGQHANGGFTPGQGQDAFITKALPALKALGNVDRQAYYGTGGNGQIWTSPNPQIVSALLG